MLHRANWARCRGLALALIALVVTSSVAVAQGTTGTITGRIQDSVSKAPISDARVVLITSNAYASTNVEGRYTLKVPAGRSELRVLRVGYGEAKFTVNVAAGQTANYDVLLKESVVKLQTVVTTATGEQRRVELGNAVATLDVASRVAEAPVKNLGDLLAAKAPGVQVLPSNMTGGGSRVRIRGTNSFTLSNDPIYVIDGVRMTSGNGAAIGVGGTTQNRANDLSPEEIENIEIVKGPSAATLYGTDASNGVIVITTKKGRAGAARWTVFAEHGQIRDRNEYPTQYAIIGKLTGATTQTKCVLTQLALGTCTMDSTTSLNVFSNQDLTPIKLGARDNYGVQVSGGTEAVRYFMSVDVQKETGPFGTPAFDQRRLDSLKVVNKGEWIRPNALGQASFRANVNAAINPKLDVSASLGFTRNDTRLPQVDNNVNSIWYNGTTGPGFTGALPGVVSNVGSLGTALNGYASYTPGETFQQVTTQNVQRFIGSAQANWRPVDWFQGRSDLGMDLTNRIDYNLCMFATCNNFGTNRQGFATDARTNIRNFTWNTSGTLNVNPRPWINSKTTVGLQYVNFLSQRSTATGRILPPGAQTPADGTTPSIGNATTPQSTLGMFIEESAALNDRLWLTAAVRTDQNSAFGTNFQRVYYPKFSVSWVMTDERWFPKVRFLDELRFRSAYGSSGAQPGPTDALRTFTTTTTAIAGADIAGLRSSLPGNPDIRPERTTEFEAGFDVKMLKQRLNVELTYYNKRTQDALFALTIAPSAGTAATSVRSNLGGVQNTGVEALINTQLYDSRTVSVDMTISATHNSNKLISLGTDPGGRPIPIVGLNTTVQQVPGYPLNGYWSRPYTYADADGNKYLSPTEVTTDTVWRFRGYSQPRDEIAITTGIDLFRRRVRFNVLVDGKGGSNLNNSETGFLCPNSSSCAYNANPKASLFDQARAVAATNKGTLNSVWGFIEPLQFWRLREIAMTYNLEDRLATRLLGARGASINLAVRNVKVWTSYTAVDPEANYSESNTQQTLLTAGPPTYFQFRININY
jgi:TonB-linked SusC/RagA family outer membrane protein